MANLSVNRNRMADIESRLVIGADSSKEEGLEEWVDWEAGASGCKLLYIACINSKVLLCSTLDLCGDVISSGSLQSVVVSFSQKLFQDPPGRADGLFSSICLPVQPPC